MYQGYYEDFESLTTRKEPHVVGGNSFLSAAIEEEVFETFLLEGYTSWEHYDIMKSTLILIDKYALVRGRLLKLLEVESPGESSLRDIYNKLTNYTDSSDLALENVSDLQQTLLYHNSDRKIQVNAFLKIEHGPIYMVESIDIIALPDGEFDYAVKLKPEDDSTCITVQQ